MMGWISGYNPFKQYKKELKRWKRWSRWFDLGPPPIPPCIARASFGYEVVENWRICCVYMYAAACNEYQLQGKGKCVQHPSPLETWQMYATVGDWPDVCCSRIPSVSDSATSTVAH
jgi:hypothetical protein